MRLRVTLAAIIGGLIASVSSSPLAAQEGPAKRLSSIVGVAVEEYGKAIDAGGRLVSDIEYEEARSEEHTSELQSLAYLVCRLLLEKKKKNIIKNQLAT